MKEQYKEQRTRGSILFPFEQYNMINPAGNLFVPYHWHNEIELIYLHSGTLTLWIEENEYHLKPGDLYFINMETLHQFASNDRSTCYFAYVFPLESLTFSSSDYCETLLQPLLNHSLRFPDYLSKKHPLYQTVQKEIMELIRLNEEKEYGYELITKACILKVIGYLVHGNLLVSPTHQLHQTFLQRNDSKKLILSYINNHYETAIHLEDLAKLLHMSPKYFSQYFKKNFSMTFMDYVTRFRIEKASILLRDTSYPVMEIGFLVGYENFSYFIRTFKRILGMTPAKYRIASSKKEC
ncbi:AraC family transcriptional regulator [Anaerosporobacter faecicola]|uniref:AraC family transcriptional regulator n=1 Tax=Anaerosporobacter faecicola TaxID=2718714 RepID=UPI001438AA83|nr:helix-turn-helix domain-containing protein [Anaerosporobacter faecicola]